MILVFSEFPADVFLVHVHLPCCYNQFGFVMHHWPFQGYIPLDGEEEKVPSRTFTLHRRKSWQIMVENNKVFWSQKGFEITWKHLTRSNNQSTSDHHQSFIQQDMKMNATGTSQMRIWNIGLKVRTFPPTLPDLALAVLWLNGMDMPACLDSLG